MTKANKTSLRRSLSHSSSRHIVWGIVAVIVLLLTLVLWQNIQQLRQQNNQLRTQLTQADSQAAACVARDAWQAGTLKTFSILTSDGMRDYSVYLPKSFTPTRYYPLIINYPGKGASVEGGFEQAHLDTLPVISAYPTQTIGTDGHTAWEGAPYSSDANDIEFTIEILDKIQAQLCIDRHRIYATGMSNGGGMVSILSCKVSNRFAAYGIVSGAMYYPDGACSPPEPTPLITVHGGKDGSVPYEGSTTRHLPNISTWSAERARDNGCEAEPTVTTLDALTTVSVWNHCENNASIENIRFHDGGHFWSPQTTELLWQFMSKHSLK
ncbi:MAG: PHB depolymerase family esterase [Candidatus Saccharimonadales bacterium]